MSCHLLFRETSDDHNILFLVHGIWQALIPDFDLGEVESARLRTGSAGGGQADGQAAAAEGTVDLPRAETRTKTPNVLEEMKRNKERLVIHVLLHINFQGFLK